MSIYNTLLVDYYDEIVFSECTTSLYEKLIAFLNSKNYSVIEENVEENNDINTVFENKNDVILICKCFSLNAIYIYLKNSDSLFYDYINQCPNCGSKHILERIPYSCVTEEDFICIENGSLGILLGACDRLGVPIPNWKCNECKMKWHHKLDLIKRYKMEKKL